MLRIVIEEIGTSSRAFFWRQRDSLKGITFKGNLLKNRIKIMTSCYQSRSNKRIFDAWTCEYTALMNMTKDAAIKMIRENIGVKKRKLYRFNPHYANFNRLKSSMMNIIIIFYAK